MTENAGAANVKLRRPSLMLIGVALLAVAFFWVLAGAQGGQVATSPDGKYQCWIATELDPEAGDAYQITMTDSDGSVLRSATVRLSNDEPTKPLRESSRALEWSADSTHVDVTYDGKLVARLFVP